VETLGVFRARRISIEIGLVDRSNFFVARARLAQVVRWKFAGPEAARARGLGWKLVSSLPGRVPNSCYQPVTKNCRFDLTKQKIPLMLIP